MSLKESNEITVKIKGSITEFYKIVEEKGFRIIDEFSMDDTYFVPISLDIKNLTTREILSKAILVRNIYDKTSKEIKKNINNINKVKLLSLIIMLPTIIKLNNDEKKCQSVLYNLLTSDESPLFINDCALDIKLKVSFWHRISYFILVKEGTTIFY